MSTDPDSLRSHSSCSEDEENPSKCHPVDVDADESDNGNNSQQVKFRRFQKTRKSSNSSLPQKSEITIERKHSSSNDDENNERRTKPVSMKRPERKLTMTTTDDDLHIHRYHPLDNLHSKDPPNNNDSLSTPTITVSNCQPSVKKVNRFQVNSIRKSQQQQILLANTAAAKSSNEDDCSVPNDRSKTLTIERQHTNTPTTDSEHPATHTDGTCSTPNAVENGHHRVRFQVTVQDKKESVHEEEKLPPQTTPSASVSTTPAAPSSTASVPGEVSHDLTKSICLIEMLPFLLG